MFKPGDRVIKYKSSCFGLGTEIPIGSIGTIVNLGWVGRYNYTIKYDKIDHNCFGSAEWLKLYNPNDLMLEQVYNNQDVKSRRYN